MNYKIDFTEQKQKLLIDAGVMVENKEYSPEQMEQDAVKIGGYIMSKSSKNGDLSKETIKYNEIIDVLVRNKNY